MPYSIEQHPDMPLFITTFSGHISAEEFAQWSVELLQLISDLKMTYGYVLMDIRQAQTDFAAIIQGLTRIAKTLAESSNALNGMFAFLGAHPMARLSVDMLRQPQYGSLEVPIFLTYADAIAALRANMQMRQRKQDAE